MHVDKAVYYHEHLDTIVYVPVIGFVGPVEAHARVVESGNVVRTPGALGSVRSSIQNIHENLP